MSNLMQNRVSRRTTFGIAAGLLAVAGTTRVFAEDAATPSASPAAVASNLPEGALGDRIQWLLDLINGDAAAITAEAIAPEFSAEMLEAASAEELAAVIGEVASKAAPLTIQEGQIATLPETPPTTAVFRADGRDGVVVQITVSVDATNGQVTGLFFKPLGFTLDVPAATPAA